MSEGRALASVRLRTDLTLNIEDRLSKGRIAVITTHPIQYHAPWFRQLATKSDLQLKVFYLWDFGVTDQVDAGFQQTLRWDLPLLEGYDSEFVPNHSAAPGTHHFGGLRNPELYERVRAFAPDGVMMMGYNYASLIWFLMRWPHYEIPLIFRGDSHRLISRAGAKEWARRALIAQLFRRFSAFLYVGKANERYFSYHAVPREKLFFAPHSVDNQRFSDELDRAQIEALVWKRELDIPKSHSVILFAGKFVTKKRPLDLLRAFTESRLPDATLLFVGAGPLEREMRQAAAPHDNIRFAPFQNQTRMPRTYAISDLFVLPSFGEGETWGLAVNEAMCMERPIIVSDHVGCAEDLVHPQHNGLIFPAGNVAALADCLREALSDRERLRQWGAESRRIINGYSYAQMTQGLREALAYLQSQRR
jgi:glycosyltransferase involved in cell wall biosynthesis